MSRALFIISVFLIPFTLAYASGSRPKKTPSSADSCTVTLSESDSARIVELSPGKTLCIELAENPGTGYTWELTISDTSRINQFTRPEIQNPTPSKKPIVGAEVKRIYRFRTLSPGESDLHFIYHRIWEKDVPPEKTFECHVIIK